MNILQYLFSKYLLIIEFHFFLTFIFLNFHPFNRISNFSFFIIILFFICILFTLLEIISIKIDRDILNYYILIHLYYLNVILILFFILILFTLFIYNSFFYLFLYFFHLVLIMSINSVFKNLYHFIFLFLSNIISY